MKTTIHIYNTRETWLMLCLLLATLQVKALDKIGNVYCIHNATELNEFGQLIADGETNANGMLMNDIDFSGWTYWEPIGGRAGNNPYCGHFDGGGHRIRNFNIDNDNASRNWNAQGVFGTVTAGCVIANLIFDNSCSIKGQNYVGGIAGEVRGDAAGTVKFVNCGNEGSVTGNTTSGERTGGILGGSSSTVIQIEFKNCYNSGNVKGYSWCGTISGKIESSTNATVTNCYNIGSVQEICGTSMHLVANCSTYNNCYFLSGTINQGNATAVSTANDLIGKFGDDYEGLYPYVPTFDNGYYQIGNLRAMKWFRDMVNNYLSVNARQTAAIDLTGIDWIPIGTYSNNFTGYYDGGWHDIDGINHPLFGVSSNAHFTKIAIESGNIRPTVMGNGEVTTGSIVAQSYATDASSTTMTYCYSRATLYDDDSDYTRPDGSTVKSMDIGGLAGRYEGTIENCFFAGTIESTHTTNSAGGLIGACNGSYKTHLLKSYVDAPINATNPLQGKFVGWMSEGSIVEYCVINKNCGITDDQWGGPWTGNNAANATLTALVNTDDFSTGQACWYLNKKTSESPTWFQTLGVDSYPVWKNAKVVNGGTSTGIYYNGITGFTHYVGDVYSGTNTWLGSETPSSLQYPGGIWKTNTDDPRINSGATIQRVHELESDVWVIPGQEVKLIPFSDFDWDGRTQYYDNYVRWYDYTTDAKSSKLQFPGQGVITLDKGVLGGLYLTSNRLNGSYSMYHSSADASKDVLDVIAMDASATMSDANMMNTAEEGYKTINEPTLLFRHIFNVRNAKKRADEMTADVTANNNYITTHKIQLMAPKGVPFQYRLDCPESNLWDDTATPTDYWYKKSDGSYGQVWHYVVETKFNGNTYETKNNETMEPGRAYTYKARGNMNLMLYMLDPQVGTYEITLYAADKNGKKINIQGTSTPIKLMAYTLVVMDDQDANMVTEEDLYAETNMDKYKHQWPSVMKEFYGSPKTSVTFDDIDPALCDPNGQYYRWPRKWEESSYAFGYNQRYDYNMYVVANDASATPYHNACTLLSQDNAYPYKDYVNFDRLYADTKGKQQGFFYYTNAASDPGRMTVLNIGKNFCTGTEVFVSAWVKEMSSTAETANVVFSFKGVDADGKETTINSFVTGYVTGGVNTKTGYGNADTGTSDNPDNRGKWMHVYYHFPADGAGYDHYIISVENNCVSSGGADYAIDDIEAFVCRPAVEARQMKPVCNGSVNTDLLLTVDFDRLLKAFAKTEASSEGSATTQTLDYCFVRKDVYQEEFNAQKAAGKRDAEADAAAFDKALVRGAYGTDVTSKPTYTYGQLTYNTHYDSNPRYDENDQNTWQKRQAMSKEPVNGLRSLVFPSDANDGNMKIGSTYMISIIDHKSANPGASDFKFYDECSKVSEFTVIFSGEVKVDGQLQSKEDGTNVCANQKPKVTIDLNGIGVGGELHKITNAYFDWYYGPLNTKANYEGCYNNAQYNGVQLDDALAHFRDIYYEATEADFLNPSKCPVAGNYTQAHYECIKHFLDEGLLSLYLNANTVSTMEQFNKEFSESEKFYIVAVPFDPQPELNYKYCLEPIQVTFNLNTRQPDMKDGDDQGLIHYPASMADVPLRIGLRQLWKARMNDSGTIESVKATDVGNYVFLPLRDISPVTEGVKSLIEKADDDFIYLTASDDPNVAAGKSGALKVSTDASEGNIRVIGKVVDITADRDNKQNNKCHLGFIRNFKFREGYSYTIKFHFQENYSGVSGDHTDVCPGDVLCTIKVVPEYQKWTGAENDDWNNDRNWARVSKDDLHVTGEEWNDFVTDGGEAGNYANDNNGSFVPADFTKVIIPADAARQPKLYDLRTGNVVDVTFSGLSRQTPFIQALTGGEGSGSATENINYHMSSVDTDGGNVACRTWYDHTCQQIHFLPNAELLNQQHLYYEKAWVDIELAPWQWHTLASPLKGVVAGDMYLPSATGRQGTPLFQPITFNTSDYNRFNPAVYQRGWDKAKATVFHLDGTQSDVMVSTTWSHVYNDVNEAYCSGNGFSIKAELPNGAPTDTKVLFRLPKDDKKYLYYNSAGDKTGNETSIVADSETRSYRLYDLTDAIAAVQTQNAGKYFLIGNPFMAHLNMAEFFAQNPQYEPKYWMMSSDGQHAAIMDETTGGFVGTATGAIPPMQGFFVQAKEMDKKTTPRFTAGMMTLGRQYSPEGTTRSGMSSSSLTITASDGANVSTRAMVCVDGNTSEGFRSSEDMELFDDGLHECAKVYTMADSIATCINQVPTIKRIPLGVVATDDAVTELTFSGAATNDLILYDKATSDSIPLHEGMKYSVKGSSHAQLYLVGNGMLSSDQQGNITIQTEGRKVNVLSMPQQMKVEAYSAMGVLVKTAEGNTGEVTLTLPSEGVYVIKCVGDTCSACKKIMVL